jgi:hypothetical protein
MQIQEKISELIDKYANELDESYDARERLNEEADYDPDRHRGHTDGVCEVSIYLLERFIVELNKLKDYDKPSSISVCA